jgi:acyl carrier protein
MTAPTDDDLLDLIAHEAQIDRAKLEPQATLESLGIDSVDTVSVLFAVEEKYGIRLETDELSHDLTLGQMMALVQSKGAVGAA